MLSTGVIVYVRKRSLQERAFKMTRSNLLGDTVVEEIQGDEQKVTGVKAKKCQDG